MGHAMAHALQAQMLRLILVNKDNLVRNHGSWQTAEMRLSTCVRIYRIKHKCWFTAYVVFNTTYFG